MKAKFFRIYLSIVISLISLHRLDFESIEKRATVTTLQGVHCSLRYVIN